MIDTLRSIRIWIFSISLIALWLPLMAMRRLFDRDPVHYHTGYLFRKLGRALARVNPAWHIRVLGEKVENPRHPYVVVSNHQSLADIPVVSHLPWEMKWMGKEELFKLPIIGWMMHLSADIKVDRKTARSGAAALIAAQKVLAQKCSVMIFPEGTRTLDGRVRAFADGAFHLAIRAKVPIIPVALEGTFDCIPKNSWKFGKPSDILLKVLAPIDTSGFTTDRVAELRELVRRRIMEQVAEWRGVTVAEVDGTLNPASA